MTGKFAFWNYKLKEIYAELDGDVNWGLVNEDGWFEVYSISKLLWNFDELFSMWIYY